MERLKPVQIMEQEAVEPELQSVFSRIQSINPDTVGWIRIPNTVMDYAMVQCNSNQTYVDTNFYGKRSKYGAIFVDMNCRIGPDFSNQNTTIYGHNMKDGQMFGILKNYRAYDFYQKHPFIEIQLTDSALSRWEIFAVFVSAAYPDPAQNSMFEYRQRDFGSQQEFIEWIDECKKRSLLNISVDIQPHDQVLTLSTCTYEFDDARFVVMARRVHSGEKAGA